ncbi:DUF6985 domain-containing protein [Rhodopirellula baltica]
MKIIASKEDAYRSSNRFSELQVGDITFLRQEWQSGLYSCECETFVPLWGDNLRVLFSTADADLSPDVSNRLNRILTHDQCLRELIYSKLADYFQSNVLSRYETDEAGRRLPSSPSRRQLRSMYGEPDLHLNAAEETDRPTKISLYFNTSWNIEHPVEVVVEDWVIQRVR